MTNIDANTDRWSAEDDVWRGYYRAANGEIILDDRNVRVLDLLERRPHGRLLDVGCANGVLTNIFATRAQIEDVSGVDGVDMNVPFPFTKVDLDKNLELPFPDRSFDVVISLETIEHVHDTDRFASELRRVLKPNGYAIISAPRIDGFLSIGMLMAGLQPPAIDCSIRRRYGTPQAGNRVSGHVSHFTRRALIELLSANGLEADVVEQAGIYSGWVHAVANPPLYIQVPLWLLAQIPFKQDVTIARVRHGS